MAVKHVNRKGRTFYLHQTKTKTGKPKYFFSMKGEGGLVESIPEGFEIYENQTPRSSCGSSCPDSSQTRRLPS